MFNTAHCVSILPQAFNSSSPTGQSPFWPPRVPDNVETIAASYVQKGTGGKVRLFNLSPDTKISGMAITSGTAKKLGESVLGSWGEAMRDALRNKESSERAPCAYPRS